MIAYAIEAAKKSELFEKIIVSTDDKEIAEIAIKYGAEIPFMRPAELSDDFAGTVPVIAHAIGFCQNLGWKIDNVCCIYPGVPLVREVDIKKVFELIDRKNGDYFYPITEFPSSIQRALRLLKNGKTEPIFPGNELTRTQDSETAYHDAGQFYWGKANAWLYKPNIHASGFGYVIPKWRVVDIDTQEDWERAEIIYAAMNILTKADKKEKYNEF